jgi:UTP-glucose-1-phosphate uridylyltransferase/mevalonate kinase
MEIELFVPGRVCLFGEHSDWAGGYRRINSAIDIGYALISGTNQGVYAKVKPHADMLIIKSSFQQDSKRLCLELPMQADVLLEEAKKGGLFSYVSGVAYQILTHYKVRGLEIDNFKTDLPVKKGLSSSAAVCVLTARAFNHVYDLKMTVRGEMDLAYRGEVATPSRCGRMDQGCAYGNHPVLMTFDGDQIDVKEVSCGEDLYFVIADLGAQKNTIRILQDLNKAFPFPETDQAIRAQEYLGPINKHIVLQTMEALKMGDAKNIGRLMREAQQLFDEHLGPLCPEELTAPLLHKTLEHVAIQQYVWGGKGVGSQGDGSVQFIARDLQSQQKVMDILRTELGMNALSLTIPKTNRLKKAVITAAGFGTRLFPMTKVSRKEFMPIIDKDGVVKPLILANVEEALSAGIEEVFIVIQEKDRGLFESFFYKRIPFEVNERLSSRHQEYNSYLDRIGSKIHLVIQNAQEGLGHAIYCTKDYLNNEPFLLILGDHYFLSDDDKSSASQLAEEYDGLGANLIGLTLTSKMDVSRFGAVGGDWEEKDLLFITKFKEKPSLDFAEEFLKVEGTAPGYYYTLFGLYVLHTSIFEILEKIISEDCRSNGEIQLTEALERLRQCTEVYGFVVNAKRIDIGTPNGYRQALLR